MSMLHLRYVITAVTATVTAAVMAPMLLFACQPANSTGAAQDGRRHMLLSQDTAVVMAQLQREPCLAADAISADKTKELIAAYNAGHGDACIRATLVNTSGEEIYRYLILLPQRARVVDDAGKSSAQPKGQELTIKPVIAVAWGHWDLIKHVFIPGPVTSDGPARVHENVIGIQYAHDEPYRALY